MSIVSSIGTSLFKRAIIQSGSALSSWAIDRDPLKSTRQVAESVNCTQHWSNSRRLVQCLKGVPWKHLINVPVRNYRYLSSFGPTIDGRSVLPSDPRTLTEDLSDESVFTNVDILLGVMKNEGKEFLIQYICIF